MCFILSFNDFQTSNVFDIQVLIECLLLCNCIEIEFKLIISFRHQMKRKVRKRFNQKK